MVMVADYMYVTERLSTVLFSTLHLLFYFLQVIVNVLGFEKALNSSIALPRLHHQLFPNYITAEAEFPECTRAFLRSKGHRVITGTPEAGAVVQGLVTDEEGNIYATSDARKGGSPAGY